MKSEQIVLIPNNLKNQLGIARINLYLHRFLQLKIAFANLSADA